MNFTLDKSNDPNAKEGANKGPEMIRWIYEGLFVDNIFCYSVTPSLFLLHRKAEE
jgi:hypothetical protein